MKVVVTSDFHHRPPPKVPPCDLLILAGDVLPAGHGTMSAARNPYVSFAGWLDSQPAKDIVGVAGNHDWIARDNSAAVRELPWTYLHNEAAVVQGVNVWGSPMSMPFNNWAFMAPEDKLSQVWATIPDDVEILVVHGPAHGILDKVTNGENVGSRTLRDRIGQLPRLRLFVTGHIHEQYGIDDYIGAAGQSVLCVNASYLTLGYVAGNEPITVEIDEL